MKHLVCCRFDSFPTKDQIFRYLITQIFRFKDLLSPQVESGDVEVLERLTLVQVSEPGYFMAIIQTGMMTSGKPSCLSVARTSKPALATMVLMMSRWRLMLLSMGSSLQPCRAMLSLMMMTPFGRRLLLQRTRKSSRSLSVR